MVPSLIVWGLPHVPFDYRPRYPVNVVGGVRSDLHHIDNRRRRLAAQCSGNVGEPGDQSYSGCCRLGWEVFLTDGNMILRVDAATGILTRFAGNDTHGPLGDDGPAINAGFYYPQGLAFDSAGNLYIADTLNSRIRKISNGIITTVAGNGMHSFGGDNGPATSAQLKVPRASRWIPLVASTSPTPTTAAFARSQTA